MKAFFRGWRRKAGIITLLMACASSSVWLRSFVTTDWLTVPGGKRAREPLKIVSSRGSVAVLPLRYSKLTEAMQTFELSVPKLYSRPAVSIETQPGIWFTWHWKRSGFGYATEDSGRYWLFMFPYWSIVVPLTFLAAYLILWKPKQKEPRRA
ncbi:MAG: hypothetical protein JWP89_3202 [Schlesneria sp.]|nr:hypothetical protein [Schlesneria sp.]